MKHWRRSSTPEPHTVSLALPALAALLVLAAALSLVLGSVLLSPAQLWQGMTCGDPSDFAYRIFWFVRLPRTCGCVLAGAALAVSGAMIQSVLANPLAAPNVIGVNSGAGLAVTLCCALFPNAVGMAPLWAFLGAFAGVMLVLFIAERTGASRITLVLAGVAVSNLFSAGVDAIVTLVPESLSGYSDFRIGGLVNVPMARIIPAVWIILAALLLAFSLHNELDVLALGRETAQSLGLAVRPLRVLLLAIAAALAGAAVSFAGLLGFVGLIVPHMMRRLVGSESRRLLPACALGGGVLVTLCDLLARLVAAPYELPVGVVLSFAGGPFFIWLLLRQRGGRTLD